MLRKSIALGLCTFTACLYSVAPAQAAALHWTLNNIPFDDDGTATGGFDFDADTSTYSNFNVTTTSGIAIIPQFTYNAASATLGGSSTASKLTLIANPQLLTVNAKAVNRQRVLTLDWLSALTAAGGIVNVADTSEETQNDSVVGKRAFINAGRFISSGTISGAVSAGDTASVPTPMLLPGLVGMGIAAFRRRVAEAASA
jgi:hypothetical protein